MAHQLEGGHAFGAGLILLAIERYRGDYLMCDGLLGLQLQQKKIENEAVDFWLHLGRAQPSTIAVAGQRLKEARSQAEVSLHRGLLAILDAFSSLAAYADSKLIDLKRCGCLSRVELRSPKSGNKAATSQSLVWPILSLLQITLLLITFVPLEAGFCRAIPLSEKQVHARLVQGVIQG